MADIDTRRMAAEIDGDFVVFIIGIRINRWWKPWSWLPVLLAMPKMVKELEARPEYGCLATELGLGIVIQYRRSFEQLEAYARNPDARHLPAWVAVNRTTITSGDYGLWHETYLVSAGQYEAVYRSMPPRGLGKAGRLVPAVGRLGTAPRRLGRTDDAHPAAVPNPDAPADAAR